MTPKRLGRALLSVCVASAGMVIAPATVASASTVDYVVTRTDGNVYVASLTAVAAAELASQPGIKFVEPDEQLGLTDGLIASSDSVTGLDAPADARDGDVIPGRFIVSFRSAASARVASRNTGDGLVAAFSNAMNGFVADLTPQQFDALSNDPDVIAIEPDTVVFADTDQSNPTWGLDRIDQRSLPLSSRYSYDTNGTGVTAYVIDSGIRTTHADFGGRVRPGFTAVSDGNGTNDCMGHGTHVAGTIGSATWGVAKNVSLVPVRVFGCSGGSTWSTILAGIDWVINNHGAGVPAVANLSLGGAYSSIVNSGIAKAVADGISVSVAAGNNTTDACTASPASEPTAITVGATTSNDWRASFSNFGSCVDLFAPGQSITSTWYTSDTAAAGLSGTSMAAPHVAGAAALYLQSNPTATPAAVQSAIVGAATIGTVQDARAGSPNRLLYMSSFTPAPPGVPSATGTVTATAGDARISLAWNAPTFDGGAAITDYIVQYSTDGSNWVTHADGVGTARTAVITGLVNYTAYTVQVAAVNAIGTGAYGARVVATPAPAGVPSSPRSLVATAGRQMATLYWSAPLSNGASAVTDYVIEYRTVANPAWTVSPDPVSAAVSATVTGLAANVGYAFRVRAVNSVGSSTPSNEFLVTPTVSTAPTAPRSVSASPRMLGATVAWTTPLDNGGGAITGYVVDFSEDGTTWSAPQRVDANARLLVLGSLRGGILHTVRVRALNEFGTSLPGITTVTPTSPSVPAAPRSASVNPGYNFLAVYWSTPASDGGSPITGYAVEYSTNSGASWVRGATLSSATRSALLTGLAGGVRHLVRVVAVNAVGWSTGSNVIAQAPLQILPPSAPRYLSAFGTGTSVTLTWSVPLTANGDAISGYAVWQSTDGTNFSNIATLAASTRSYPVPGLVNGLTYTFYVTASNSIGAGDASNKVVTQPRVAGAPSTPSGLAASVSNSTVALTWWPSAAQASAPVTDYIVEYAVSPSTTFVVFNDGVSTTTSARITGLTPDVQVAFRVKARNRYGDSPYSSTVTATPRSLLSAPTAPLNLGATAGDGRVGVAWSAPASNGGSVITAYTVTANDGSVVSGSCTTAGALSCIVNGLTNGVTYTFTATATNAIGTSAASASATAVPTSSAQQPVSAPSWGLDRIDQRNLPLDSLITRPNNGSGVTAYIIDSGILASHSQFTGRMAAGYTSISDGRGTSDCNGHGTHVAGTVAGATYGVANGATLVPVRVLDCAGSGSTSGVVAGINWMIDHHTAGVPAVANLSLGGTYSATLNDAVARAVADGITMVVAAGNSNADACLSSPSSAPAAITVAASTSSDYKASYSNYGACVDLFAPGSSIVSAGITTGTSTASMSGTSMASPHVAGVAAAILANARSLTPAQVAERLRSDATASVLSGVDATTTNSLAYLASIAATSLSMFEGTDVAAANSVEHPADELTSSAPSTGDGYEEVDEPAVAPPAAPVVAPPTKSAVSRPAIASVKRVGKNVRVTVSAPAGVRVRVYRNGVLVGSGAKRVFTVPVGRIKSPRFTVSS